MEKLSKYIKSEFLFKNHQKNPKKAAYNPNIRIVSLFLLLKAIINKINTVYNNNLRIFGFVFLKKKKKIQRKT